VELPGTFGPYEKINNNKQALDLVILLIKYEIMASTVSQNYRPVSSVVEIGR